MTESNPLQVASSPHINRPSCTTQRVMIDVLLGLLPVICVSIYVFQWYAVQQLGICVLICLAMESLCCLMRGRKTTITDGSACVTGIILALSLPPTCPVYISIIASIVAIGIGKMVFGGLGCNIFNPAMVGRAFVMLSFAASMGAGGYVLTGDGCLSVLTQATPLTSAAEAAEPLGRDLFWPLFLGNVNGSLGETSALALLLGGLYLWRRRALAWEIPVTIILSGLFFGWLAYFFSMTEIVPGMQIISGAFLFGAIFIATDPVTSPLSHRGNIIFGVGVAFFTTVFRFVSNYPEGIMFAVLLMNTMVPLINHWTIPRPLGGRG